MPRTSAVSALVLLASFLAAGAGAQPLQKQQPDPGALSGCDEKCQHKRLSDAANALRIVSCGKSACPPGPVYLDKQGQLVLPPAELERVILGMAMLGRSQGLKPQELADKVAKAKLP